MKRMLALPLLLLILTTFGLAQNWYQGELDEAVAAARSQGKLVLIDFFSGG